VDYRGVDIDIGFLKEEGGGGLIGEVRAYSIAPQYQLEGYLLFGAHE